MHQRRKRQPTPVFLPGESQGRGSLMGCRLWGRTESDMTEATQQQQQQHWDLSAQCINVEKARKPHLGSFHLSVTHSFLQTLQASKCAVLCLVTQSCLTLCDPMDCSLPGSSVHAIFQARILEWVAMPSSRGSNPGLLHCRWIIYYLSQ